MGNKSFSDLTWLAASLTNPGDEQEGGPSRQVPGVCWSRVKPSPTPNQLLGSGQVKLVIKLVSKNKEVESLEELSLSMWTPMLSATAVIIW